MTEQKIYVYDFSSTVWICKEKSQYCVFFPTKPFRKYTLITLLIFFLKEWNYDVQLYSEFDDIMWMLGDIKWMKRKEGKQRRVSIKLASFDKEGLSRIKRLLADDPKFSKGIYDFDIPEAMIPDEFSYLGKVLKTRLTELAKLCKKEIKGISLKGE